MVYLLGGKWLSLALGKAQIRVDAPPEDLAVCILFGLMLPYVLWMQRHREKKTRGISGVSMILVGIITTLALSAASDGIIRHLFGQQSAVPAVTSVSLFATVLAAPICEEVIYRGIVCSKLKPMLGGVGAAALSSALFGVAHGSWPEMLLAAAAGGVFCLLRWYADSLWLPIGVHMGANAISIVIAAHGLPVWCLPASCVVLLGVCLVLVRQGRACVSETKMRGE